MQSKNKGFGNRYIKRKAKLSKDESICKENKDLFIEFLDYQEYKLKRIRNLPKLDDSNYNTLYVTIQRLNNMNKWFNNKPFKKLTFEDIKKVYDDLEDGKILTKLGKPISDRSNYYDKYFKSKLFKMVDKDELARQVIEFHTSKDKQVRFITEEDFKKLVNNAYKPKHRLLFWLAWDFGENIGALVQLRKKDFTKEINTYNKEPQYKVNFRKEILKRSRTPRGDINNYRETFDLLEQELSKLEDEDYIFDFDYANAKKIFDRALERAGEIKVIPTGDKASWKDLRSGMACHLLKEEWAPHEVNARLGHKPSSRHLDRYINFLALDKDKPKKKVYQFEMEKLTEQLEEVRKRERLQAERFKAQEEEMKEMKEIIKQLAIKGEIKRSLD